MLKDGIVETAATALRAKNRSGANKNLASCSIKVSKAESSYLKIKTTQKVALIKEAIEPFGAALCLILRSHFWLCKISKQKHYDKFPV